MCNSCALFAQYVEDGPHALVLDISGPVGPATSDYIKRSFNNISDNCKLVIIRIDTPGGLESAMREINKSILMSPVPVVSYVSPEGARAASAGTFIVYASHIAAMAPATNLGAATPVSITAPVSLPGDDKSKDKTTPNAKINKAVNDAVAYIRSLAQERQRNVEWAEQAVRNAASLSAADALENNVIDIIATDLADLLRQLDNRDVIIQNNSTTIQSEDIKIVLQEPDWRSQFLSIITNPNIAYLFMLVGIYGLIFELANPGTVISGVIGVISLVIALYAFQVLPVNYAGLALMILGIALMLGEAFVPSFGALGIGGIVAFVIGSIILMDTDIPGFTISPGLIGGIAAGSGLIFTVVLSFAVRARKQPVVTGQEEFIGNTGVAMINFEKQGRIRFEGEIWNAETNHKIKQGQKVRIVKVQGLTLDVEPVEEDSK